MNARPWEGAPFGGASDRYDEIEKSRKPSSLRSPIGVIPTPNPLPAARSGSRMVWRTLSLFGFMMNASLMSWLFVNSVLIVKGAKLPTSTSFAGFDPPTRSPTPVWALPN